MMDQGQQGTEQSVNPDGPEVPEKPVRRRFDAAYKQRILEEADRCSRPGELGELLRREGLYSSLLSTWRRQRDEGSSITIIQSRVTPSCLSCCNGHLHEVTSIE